MNRRYKVFIDGREGTTGLQIYTRIRNHPSIELVDIIEEKRKDPDERRRLMDLCDLVILCLPDAAAREAAVLPKSPDVRIIDASSAHRTEPGWVYGFPELGEDQRSAIASAKRVTNPGCHASGIIALLRPLVIKGLLPSDYPLAITSLTGYSGAGKAMIAQYRAQNRPSSLDAPRLYGLTMKHKHISEILVMTGMTRIPAFSPII